MVGILPLLFFAGLLRRNKTITRAGPWVQAQGASARRKRAPSPITIARVACARTLRRNQSGWRGRRPRHVALRAQDPDFPALFRAVAHVTGANTAAVSRRAAPAASTVRRFAPEAIVITIKLFSTSGRRHNPGAAEATPRRRRAR